MQKLVPGCEINPDRATRATLSGERAPRPDATLTMLTPVLLLAVVVNIVGLLNNYNIRNHQLDIRVKRDAPIQLQSHAAIRPNETTNNVTNQNAPGEASDGEELTKEREDNIDSAYDLQADLLVNDSGYNEAEPNATIRYEDIVPEETAFNDILEDVSDRGLLRSKDRSEPTENEGREESDTELINAISETNKTEILETADNGKLLPLTKIAEGLLKEDSDRDDAEIKLDAKEEIEVIKELDDKLIKIKNNEDNKTQEELTKYDNEIFDYRHANILLDIILNLRNVDLNEKDIRRGKRYAPNGDRSFNNTWSGDGAIRYGGGPGYARSSSGYSPAAPQYNYINKQYTPYPNTGYLYPKYNGQNVNYPHYNNNYYNQQPYDLRNRTDYPTYPINQNPFNYNQNYINNNPNAAYINQPYFYNSNSGQNPSYRPSGYQNVAHNSSGGGTYANSFYNNYYPTSSSRNTSDRNQYMAPPAPTAPGSTKNATATSNSTGPVIMESCFMCGSFGCPQFFRKMGFLCVPLHEQ